MDDHVAVVFILSCFECELPGMRLKCFHMSIVDRTLNPRTGENVIVSHGGEGRGGKGREGKRYPARGTQRVAGCKTGTVPDDKRQHALEILEQDRIMAVLRQIPEEYLVPLADLLVEGGVRSLEITHDYERTTDDVAMLSQRYGADASVGVGTTWSVELAESAAAAGAEFCVIPGVDVPTAQRSAELGMLTLPGVQTPAEIQTALRAGADVLKFFPADPPGASWLAQVVPAYSQRPFMATGGVTVENMAEFYDAGAIAVGMANTLFGDYRELERAPSLIAAAVAVASEH
jgi:2-dehydro-3-deoxyphosphogluconate aldolase/(4S)-4-hydroxy-2-oxoglutarate aldolase